VQQPGQEKDAVLRHIRHSLVCDTHDARNSS
jgi:hypothetical protein